jgi:prepilin-type N-terminal cleavage/methylation domain-containing protein
MIKRRHRVAFPGPLFSRNDEKGLTLIEVLVALGILSAVAVVILLGMSTSSKAVMVSQERVAVDNLAKSELEYIKSLPYDATSIPLVYAVDPAITVPQGYNIAVAAQRLDPKGDGFGNDDGMQRITINITHNEEPAFTLVGYKVK